MSMLSIFNVSGSAASAQSQRLNVVASNLANADTVAGPNGQAYKARQVTFQTELMGQTANDPTAASIRAPTPRATSPTATSTRSRRWST
jgi:flagellar basal-body rod protein FlgC